MLIKEKDQNQQQIDYLSDLLERDLPENKKRQIERELKCLYSGDKGEKSSAYYLEFDFKDAKNWALIHDLRIEHNGQVAQIDHLLIGRMMDCYVIESKNFSSGVSISDEGDFSYFYQNKPCAIPSPIEQNERHIRLLDRFLSDNKLYPTRLGVQLKPNFRNIVLLSPTSNLKKPKKGLYDCSAVMKADKFLRHFNKDVNSDPVNSLLSITKVMSSESLRGFAEKLAYLHEPIVINYMAKFSINDVEENNSVGEDDADYSGAKPNCPKCNEEMVKRTVKKEKDFGREFWGCCHYPDCDGVVNIKIDDADEPIKQTTITIEPILDVVEPVVEQNDDVPLCPQCNKIMNKRVAKHGDNKGNKFWGCSDYPSCKGILTIEPIVDVVELVVEQNDDVPLCPQCNKAMNKCVAKHGDNKGNEFWGCSGFPSCKAVITIESLVDVVEPVVDQNDGVPPCPKCNKTMNKRVAMQGDNKGNEFWGCSDFPNCKGTITIEPIVDAPESIIEQNDDEVLCPQCNDLMIKRKSKKGENYGSEFWGCSNYPKCRGTLAVDS